MSERKCPACGTLITPGVPRVERTNPRGGVGLYCNDDCYEWDRKRVTLPCKGDHPFPCAFVTDPTLSEHMAAIDRLRQMLIDCEGDIGPDLLVARDFLAEVCAAAEFMRDENARLCRRAGLRDRMDAVRKHARDIPGALAPPEPDPIPLGERLVFMARFESLLSALAMTNRQLGAVNAHLDALKERK